MLVSRIVCITLVLGFTLVAAETANSGIPSQGPRDCGEVYLAGGQVEGYYGLFPNVSNPDEAALVYCGISDGMLPHNSSFPRATAKNCQDLKDGGMSASGINVIYPYAAHPESPVIVYCNQELLGGGWTVFQRRDDYDIQLDFYRTFNEYGLGFGNVGTEFWLGNSIIHELTQQNVNELYVDLTSFGGVNKYAHYEIFDVGSLTAVEPYRLTVSHYSGDAGDSLSYHDGMGFSTYDADRDLWSGNCAERHKGGWWYRRCYWSDPNGIYYDDGQKNAWWYRRVYGSNPNGIYYDDGREDDTSANWGNFPSSFQSLRRIEMMTRPLKLQ